MSNADFAVKSFNILLVGFSSYEKGTIESFFRIASQRAPHWKMTSNANEAGVVLLNATSQQEADDFKSQLNATHKVVIVGASDFGTNWTVVQRPLKLTSILHVLDTITFSLKPVVALTASLREEAFKIVDSTPPAFSDAEKVVTPPSTLTNAPSNAPVKTASMYKSDASHKAAPIHLQPTSTIKAVPAVSELNEAPSFHPPASEVDVLSRSIRSNVKDAMGRVLIVDDSDIALKYMQTRLRPFGYEAELAKSGEEALMLVGKQSYQFVFLDVMMQGMDGYKTCRAIKNLNTKNRKSHGEPSPVVVMLTSRGGTIDKIRGSMAGCDAYLTKPLNEKQLALVLIKHDAIKSLQRMDVVQASTNLTEKSRLRVR